MAKTKYQTLVARKKSHCAGRVKKDSLNKAVKAYIADAVKKGKSKADATAIANRVVKGKCSASISGTKKRKPAKRKSKKRK